MTIGSVNSNSALTSSLQAQGLSTDTIKLVATDLRQVQTAAGSTSSSVDGATVRAALDQKISDDVASGKLSQDDADKIGKALDQMDGTASAGASASSGTAQGGKAGGAPPAGGGGGGGGGSSEKTELSRTVTVSGGVKTTVITYTDGTTETKTQVDVTDKDSSAKGKVDDKADGKDKTGAASAAKDAKKTGASAYDDKTDTTAQDYLAKIEPGSLFDAYA